MINTTRFKKILHILKQNSDDLNINICIIDYDVAQECDYEEITLYLKETNTQNGAVVYKNFVIRSQLYYDADNNKYMSALDGDIFTKNEAPTKIDILSDITEESLKDIDSIIKVKLMDSETNEPLKNQPIFMYSNNEPDKYIASAITNKYGEASFNYHLVDPTFVDEQKIIHFEYLGNKIYRKSSSKYVLVDIHGAQMDNVTSTINECVTVNGKVRVSYQVSLNNDNLVDEFHNLGLDVDESSLLTGKVLFYLHNNQDSIFLGSSNIEKINNQTISNFDFVLPEEYRNTDVIVQAIFEGNSFIASNSTSKTIHITTTAPKNISLDINGLFNGFETSLSFDIDRVSDNDFCNTESGFDMLAHTYGDISFYLKNSQGTWGTLEGGLPFYVANQYDVTLSNDTYSCITSTDYLTINLDNYGLQEHSNMEIKAVFSGNAIVDGFEISALVQIFKIQPIYQNGTSAVDLIFSIEGLVDGHNVSFSQQDNVFVGAFTMRETSSYEFTINYNDENYTLGNSVIEGNHRPPSNPTLLTVIFIPRQQVIEIDDIDTPL